MDLCQAQGQCLMEGILIHGDGQVALGFLCNFFFEVERCDFLVRGGLLASWLLITGSSCRGGGMGASQF